MGKNSGGVETVATIGLKRALASCSTWETSGGVGQKGATMAVKAEVKDRYFEDVKVVFAEWGWRVQHRVDF